MNDQDSSQAVTLADAVNQVKKWAVEKKYEQVKEGCEEILQVEPDNKEVKDLLEQANNELKPKPAPVAAPSPVTAPAAPAPTPIVPKPAASPAPTAPAAQVSPADIFKKPAEPLKKEEVKPSVPAKPAEQIKKDKEPKEKSEKGVEIITVVIFVALLGGFIYAFLQGWLNPFYDWILGLFGL